MNLMDMVNGLNRMDDTNPFSPTAFLLAVKLIDLFNRLRWADSVAVDLERMRVMAKCSARHTTIRARDELIERGVLVLVAKGKKGLPTLYRLNDLSDFGASGALNPALNPAPIIDNTTYYQEKTIKDETRKVEKRTRFSPPTADDVRAYCAESGYHVDADRFCDFYAAKGWRIGNTPMKDWRAAVRNWAKRENGPGRAATAGQSGAPRPVKQVREQQYTQREYDDADELPRWMQERLKTAERSEA